MKTSEWEVHATDADILGHVGFIDSGVLDADEYDAGTTVILSDDGYAAEFHAYRRDPIGEYDLDDVGRDVLVTVRLETSASTYADVFCIPWESIDTD